MPIDNPAAVGFSLYEVAMAVAVPDIGAGAAPLVPAPPASMAARTGETVPPVTHVRRHARGDLVISLAPVHGSTQIPNRPMCHSPHHFAVPASVPNFLSPSATLDKSGHLRRVPMGCQTAAVELEVALGVRAQKKAKTRRALADTALALFAERGFDATPIEDIAAACEVSARTFFRYFATK